MADQLGEVRVGVDQPLRELLGVRGRVADPLDARNLVHVLQQQREVGAAAVAHRPQVGIDVLAQQRDLAHAVRGQIGDLGQHIVDRSRHLLAARIRHHAEAAVLAAPLHDRDECAGTLDARRRQVVELFDLGKADVDLRPAAAFAACDQLRQPVQCLWTEDHIHVGCALYNGRALLAGDATAHADHQFRVAFLQRAHAAKIGKHLLLCLLAH